MSNLWFQKVTEMAVDRPIPLQCPCNYTEPFSSLILPLPRHVSVTCWLQCHSLFRHNDLPVLSRGQKLNTQKTNCYMNITVNSSHSISFPSSYICLILYVLYVYTSVLFGAARWCTACRECRQPIYFLLPSRKTIHSVSISSVLSCAYLLCEGVKMMQMMRPQCICLF